MKTRWVCGVLFAILVIRPFFSFKPQVDANAIQDRSILSSNTQTIVPNSSNPAGEIQQQDAHGHWTKDSTSTRQKQRQDESPTKNPDSSIEISISSQEHQLPIDENSTITSDIRKIWHDADAKEICVALQPNAKCPNPALLGRLSGPALAILEWTQRISTKGTVLCGGYGHYWLDAGSYFVEIIILYCNDFGVSALPRINNITAWLEADHKSDCVEDTEQNRITAKNESSVIQIPTSTKGRESYNLGRWIRKSDESLPPPRPLYTRFQPLKCFRNLQGTPIQKGSPLERYCIAMTERDNDGTMNEQGENVTTGLYEYEFQWNMKGSEQELLEKLRQRYRNNEVPKICAIGDSHSRLMVQKSLPNLKLKGLFDYVETVWISPNSIVKKIQGRDCHVFFVQVGSWPASFHSKGHPFSFGKYHDKLKLHVQNILAYNPNATIYLPAIDLPPLMAKVNICKEWRTPTMLDGYSYVNQMIVNELGTERVQYIDTNFIIYTHWDGSPDWYHLMENVRNVKTLYMTAIMLGETKWFA